MADPLQKQINELRLRYMALIASSFLDDFKIDASEKKRIEALGDKLDKLVAQQQIDGVVSKLKTDAGEQKAFQDKLKALPAESQKIAADVLEVLYKKPPPADQTDQLAKLMKKLPAGQDMAVGQALNAIGVYLPNLKPDSPSAEDATARIKKIHMSGLYETNSPQGDYVRDMIREAKDQGFKVVLQITKDPADPAKAADLKAKLVGDLSGVVADVAELNKYVEVLEADRRDYVWAEDNKWLTADGKTVRTTPKVSGDAQSAAEAFVSADLGLGKKSKGYEQEGHHTAGKARVDKENAEFPVGLVDEGAFQGAVTNRNEHLSARALADKTRKALDTTRTYNEGGNMLAGTLPNGQPYGVIGRDGVLISAFHLQEQFDADPSKVPEFDPKNVEARLKELKKSGMDPTDVSQTIKRLEGVYARDPDKLGSPAAKAQFLAEKKEFEKDKTAFAEKFVAKLDIVKDIFAEDTKIPREQLIFVPQPDFHVDMHMRPVAPGQIMINDFKQNIALIDAALKKAAPGSWEEKELKTMRKHAEEMQKIMGPVMEEIEKRCQQGGLETIKAPGVVEGQFESVKLRPDTIVTWVPPADPADPWIPVEARRIVDGISGETSYSRKELGAAIRKKIGAGNDHFIDGILDEWFTRHVNFMNAIPGTKPGTNEQFYMTNATSNGPLRDVYEEYLKKKGVEEVLWMGDDGGGKGQRTGAEESLLAQGGLDCRENH